MRWMGIFTLLLAVGSSRAEDVEGFGRTVEEAKLDARQHLLDRLTDRMRAMNLDLNQWKPTLSDVEPWVVDGRAAGSVHVEPVGLLHRWVAVVEMPSDGELRRLIQAHARRRVAGFVVGILLIGAIVAAGWRSRPRRAH